MEYDTIMIYIYIFTEFQKTITHLVFSLKLSWNLQCITTDRGERPKKQDTVKGKKLV